MEHINETRGNPGDKAPQLLVSPFGAAVFSDDFALCRRWRPRAWVPGCGNHSLDRFICQSPQMATDKVLHEIKRCMRLRPVPQEFPMQELDQRLVT